MKSISRFLAPLTAVAAGVALCSNAMAQQGSSVTIYGLLDTGVEYVNNVGANKKGLSRLPTASNSAPSRLGFRGSEDLGNGLSAIFTLEMGIDPGDGTMGQGGRAFGRQAFVGLKGDFGTITLGRIYTMTFWSGIHADTLGGGIYGTGSIDSYIPNARADNAIGYMYDRNGWGLGATYSFGRDTVKAGPPTGSGTPAGTNCAGEAAGDSKACREWSVMVKYNAPTWGVALANDRIHGSDAGNVFGGLNTSSSTHNRLILNGWVKLGETKVGAGVNRHTVKEAGLFGSPARRGHMWYLGAQHPITPQFDLAAQWVGMRFSGVSGYNTDLLALRGTYKLSKRTSTFAQIGYIKNGDNSAVQVSGGTPGSSPVAGVNQTAVNVGIRHVF
ncbi:MAG: porin [Comamonas sp.]|nr:porin [Comamonas sp.]